MEQIFTKVRDALLRGEDVVLAGIIASSGSTPRGSGARMAVFADGSTAGTVGGGAVEHHCTLKAAEALRCKQSFIQGFDLSHDQTAGIGMICGGRVTVFFQFFSGGDQETVSLISYIAGLFSERRNTWLITEIANGSARRMGVYEEGASSAHGSGFDESDILPLLRSRAVLSRTEPMLYAEPLTRAAVAYVFGGGHVSQELVPVISHIGFRVVLLEDRPEFAEESLFPMAHDRRVVDYSRLSDTVSVKSDDYIIIMTRGHQSDFDVLHFAMLTDASYIGVIGSRKKIAATNERLVASGIKECELSRIHTPIGIDIGAETPAEIAISVAAELIAHRAGRSDIRYGK